MTAEPPILSRPVLPFIPTEDPIVPLPSYEEMRAAIAQNEPLFVQWLTEREAELRRREEDPLRHGWRPKIWDVCDDLLTRGCKVVLVDPRDDTPREIIGGSEIYISGGQRSSKTEYAAGRVVRCLVEKGWRRAWCFRETGPNSTAMQQPRVYKMLPPEWRKIKKNRIANLNYTIKGGFTGEPPSFVGPNGSQCWFRNYAQDINTAQGEELDIAWLDEAKDAMKWIEEVRFRLTTRNGVMVITFTPIDGYSTTVRQLIDGATTIQHIEADPELLPDAMRQTRISKIANTEPRPVSTSLAVAKRAEASEGPERDGHKPLMRNRTANDEASPTGHTASDTFEDLSGGVESRHEPNERPTDQRASCSPAPVKSGSGSSAPPAQNPPCRLQIQSTLKIQPAPDGPASGGFPPAVPQSFGEMLPRVQQAAYQPLKIVYFNVFDNPFGNPPEIIEKAKAKGREGILTRCYGVPTKPTGVKFPTFRPEVHCITPEQFRTLAPEGTNKHVCDPCSGRNFAHIWARRLPDERTLVVYRESPSPGQYVQGVGDPGWWAEAGDKADGAKGDAQKPFGWGHERNIEEILRLEGWRDAEIAAALAAGDCDTPPKRGKDEPPVEEVACRDMDSRFGSAPTITRSETKTLIESMADLGMTFEPAPGEHQQEGIDELHDLLYFDPLRPLGPENKPKLVIVENCRNVIWALQNWTGNDGQHGACKDFIDLLRYVALDPPVYVEPGRDRCHGGGAY